MAELSNPHDRFFKEVMSCPEVAQDFLVNYLSQDVVALLDVAHDPSLNDEKRDLMMGRACALQEGQGALTVLWLTTTLPPPASDSFDIIIPFVEGADQTLRIDTPQARSSFTPAG